MSLDQPAAHDPLGIPVCGAPPPVGKLYGPCVRFVHEPEEMHESLQPGIAKHDPPVLVEWRHRMGSTQERRHA